MDQSIGTSEPSSPGGPNGIICKGIRHMTFQKKLYCKNILLAQVWIQISSTPRVKVWYVNKQANNEKENWMVHVRFFMYFLVWYEEALIDWLGWLWENDE
jgi:hypothetical protein